jgi:peroxiredoxin
LKDLASRQITLVAISSDAPDVRDRLVGKLGLTFPVLADPDRRIIKLYGVEDAENEIAWPALFVIGQDGVIRERVMLDTYKQRPIVTQVLAAIPSGTASAAPSGPPSPSATAAPKQPSP